MFIVFEGADGSGKTTALRNLEKYLLEKEKKVVAIEELKSTNLSKDLRSILLYSDREKHPLQWKTESLLMAASRSQCLDEIVRPTLEKKDTIMLLDRYIPSTLVYQGLSHSFKNIKELNERMTYLQNINEFDIKPDITFYFDITYDTSKKRRLIRNTTDNFENRGERYIKNIVKSYKIAYDMYHSKYNMVQIDANKSEEEVMQQILEVVNI